MQFDWLFLIPLIYSHYRKSAIHLLSSTRIVNEPAESVIARILEFFTVTVAPKRGILASVVITSSNLSLLCKAIEE